MAAVGRLQRFFLQPLDEPELSIPESPEHSLGYALFLANPVRRE